MALYVGIKPLMRKVLREFPNSDAGLDNHLFLMFISTVLEHIYKARNKHTFDDKEPIEH